MASDIVKGVRKLRGCCVVALSSGESLRVPTALFRLHPLREGDAVDREQYEARLEADAYPLARDRAVRLLSQRDYTEQMLCRKLVEPGYPPAAARRVIAFLRQHRFLDDQRYAENLLRRKQRSQGSRGIRQALREKGVDGELAERTLSQFSEEEELSAASLLAKKYLARSRSEARDAFQKAVAYLVRRGYGFELARKAVASALPSEEE